jgi:hypothetical protein
MRFAFPVRGTGPRAFGGLALFLGLSSFVLFATSVPNEIQEPGTQPLEVPDLYRATSCDGCHGGYDPAVEPAANWRAGMMSMATRDPLFWAAMAVAEQDFDGSGDLCLRCHTPDGWISGRSTPTDGSALLDEDRFGVDCHLCHTLTDPDQSEHLGVQNAPFLANDGGMPPEGWYGSGMYVLWGGNARLGPYANATAPHATLESNFHRSAKLCWTCHDVSNPAVGDLAHNNGAMVPLAPGTFSGVPGGPVTDKAAFNNAPYTYAPVERTFSEHQSGLLSQTLVSDYPTLPADLQQGRIQEAWVAATTARPDGNYVDGDLRRFTCQTCHMPPVHGRGCQLGSAPVRDDVPLHDQTGGNYWAPDAIQYLESLSRLRIGNGLTTEEQTGLAAARTRALDNLTEAAALALDGDTLRVINLTGHKLITGYPEGRRMWLRVEWKDRLGGVVRVDGEYGTVTADVGGTPTAVETILDLDDPHLRLYEAEPGMTQEWAAQLLGFGVPGSLALTYDRLTGAVTMTLGDLAAAAPGTAVRTFHFVLNNTMVRDTRIPPYGLSYDAALQRNCLPMPADQYGDPGAGGTYDYWDRVTLHPPAGAETATIELLYQPTSWEYIQFLDLANAGTNAFLASVGQDILEAWLATGMASPAVMATATWSAQSLSSSFCDAADGSLASCPCGNAGDPDSGCDIQQLTGGVRLSFLARQTSPQNRATVQGTGFPPTANPSAVVIRGTALDSATPVVFGDGLRCVAAPLVRLGATIASGGVSLHTFGHGGAAGAGSFYYQLWFRNQPAMYCTPDAFNLSNGQSVTWP